MGDQCTDNRYEIIYKAKRHLIEATNIKTSADEMACLDKFLFRCWQMRWLKQYGEQIVINKVHYDILLERIKKGEYPRVEEK